MTTKIAEGRTRIFERRLPTLIAVGLLAIGTTACSGIQREQIIVGAVPDDYRLNHPITISEQVATLDVPVGMQTRYLPSGMEGNVLAFASEFMRSGSGVIAIVLPDGSANYYAATGIALQIEQIMLGAGVPLGAIEFRAYPAPGARDAPVRLAYAALTASTAPCGPWTDNVARNYNNENYAAFGCATQNNLAAMVSNPLDLVYPRVMTPADAGRRTTVLAAYQAGEATATVYDAGFGAGFAEVGR